MSRRYAAENLTQEEKLRKRAEEGMREYIKQHSYEFQKNDGSEDFVCDVKKVLKPMYDTIKPFVLTHKAAFAIGIATTFICLLIMLAFNRYEFMNVNGNLVRVDRLTGEAMCSPGGRGSFRVIENYDAVEKRSQEKRIIHRY